MSFTKLAQLYAIVVHLIASDQSFHCVHGSLPYVLSLRVIDRVLSIFSLNDDDGHI